MKAKTDPWKLRLRDDNHKNGTDASTFTFTVDVLKDATSQLNIKQLAFLKHIYMKWKNSERTQFPVTLTKASIFVLVWNSSSWILFRILDDLNPLIVVLPVQSLALSWVIKSTVSGIKHVGHFVLNFKAEESNKQALQKACAQVVTCTIR